MKTQPRIVAVIVTFNSQGVVRPCLRLLSDQGLTKIVIVDCGSTDETLAVVKQISPKIEILKLNKNIGYAAGNNRGINEALKYGPDYILILNPDAELLPNSLDKLVQAAENLDGKGIFGPLILKPDRQTIWSAGGEIDRKRWTAGLVGYGEKNLRFASSLDPDLVGTRDDKKHGEFSRLSAANCDFISGTCMFIPRQLFDTGLRFYEPYFLYFEDVEFCLRANKLGFPSILVREAIVVHREISATPKLKESKEYYLARNHLLFVERNAPLRVQLREFVRSPKTLGEHWQMGNLSALGGIRDYLLRRFERYAKT